MSDFGVGDWVEAVDKNWFVRGVITRDCKDGSFQIDVFEWAESKEGPWLDVDHIDGRPPSVRIKPLTHVPSIRTRSGTDLRT